MGNKTGIQWTDATWNPIRGCSRVSEGCRHCYAEVVAARFSGPGQAYEGLARRTTKGEARWTGDILFVEKHLEDPLRWKKPSRIFVNSMSDLFHEGVSDDQLDLIFAVMAIAHRHTFQVLTKRPARMLAYMTTPLRKRSIALKVQQLSDMRAAAAKSHKARITMAEFDVAFRDGTAPFDNVWLGVSVEDQRAAIERIPLLLATPAAVRFLSCEPLLGQVDLIPYVYEEFEGTTMPDFESPRPSSRGLSWVIVGGESGPHARNCDVVWIRDIIEACSSAGVPVFVKQLGSRPIVGDLTHWRSSAKLLPDSSGYLLQLKDDHGGNPGEWREDLRVQEFPRPHPGELLWPLLERIEREQKELAQ